jgi:GT2 family glycosyltransferase
MEFDVTVIIVSFNTKALTSECIRSVFSEGSSLKKEVIVVDNGSTDGSLQEIEGMKFNTKDSKILLIKNTQNQGFAKANNQALGIAKGEYILLLNSDTRVEPGSIKALIEYAKTDEKIGVVGPRLLNPNGTVQASVFRQPTIIRALKQYLLGSGKSLDKYYPQGRDPVSVEIVVMAAFLITPLAKKKVGLLDERYFMYFEDFDYCRRVLQADLKVVYFPKASVVHHHGESGKLIADEANQWRRLIPSSKIYHGPAKHYLLNFIIWSGQKWHKLFK